MKVVKHGSSTSKKRGPHQEYLCNECGNRWREVKDPGIEQKRLLERISRKVCKAIALYALGLPLREVEQLTKKAGCTVKRETIITNLRRIEKMNCWDSLASCLRRQHPNLTIDDLDKLHKAVKADIEGTKSLRDHGMDVRAAYEMLRSTPQVAELNDKIDSIFNKLNVNELLSLIYGESEMKMSNKWKQIVPIRHQ